MFFRKITCRGSNGKEYTYLKLIENYREGGKVKQRVIANLGNIESLTPEKVDGLIAGLSRICGLSGGFSQLEAKKVLRFGEVMALHKVWEILDVSGAINQTIGGLKHDLNIPLLVELMVINQILKPQNKQAISDWYYSLYLPGLEGKELLSHHFYRALNSISKVKERLEKQFYERIVKISSVNTDIAFCLLAKGTIELPLREELNLSAYGKYFLGEQFQENEVYFVIMVSKDGIPFALRLSDVFLLETVTFL